MPDDQKDQNRTPDGRNSSPSPGTPGKGRGEGQNGRPLRIAIITCAVLEDEIGRWKQDVANLVHVEMMPQGLHNDPPKLRLELQIAIDRVEARPEIEAIVLGYGLCSRGTEAVSTKRCKLVMARAHDCITLLLGSKERYAQYVKEFPGTYWYSPGWNRHHTPPGKERYEKLRAKYVAEYGEDNADFLMESEQHWFKTYEKATYVDLGAGVTPEDIAYTKSCADWLKWSFDHQKGDPQLLVDLLSGNWDNERFLVLEPGESLAMTADDQVIQLVPKPRT